MNKLVCTVLFLFLLPVLARAADPAAQPAVIIGTIGKAGDDQVAALLGHRGVLVVRSQARWDQLAERLKDHALQSEKPLPKVDFTKENVVLVFATDRRPTDVLSLDKSDLAANPPRLEFLLSWDNSLQKASPEPQTLFVLAVLPATPTVEVTLLSSPLFVKQPPPPVIEFSTLLGENEGDIVDGLQVRITRKLAVLRSREDGKVVTVQPGEDILIDFTLQLADPGKAKPEQFGSAPEAVHVWDGKYSKGYRNYGFFVTDPKGKTVLLRPTEIGAWLKNMPHPVKISAKEPYTLPNGAEGATAKSLKELGLDTSAPGTYIITGLYEETGGTEDTKPMWGGSITTNTVTVEVRK